MIAVAIVGILAAVALPSYQSYLRRGQLQEAFANLSDYRIKMEQYYQDTKSYGTASGCANDGTGTLPGSPTPGHPLWSTFIPGSRKYFNYTCSTVSPFQTYTITADSDTPLGGTHQYTYTINESGTKATTYYKAATSTAGCWLSSSASC